ncbi:MAG: hypothetical protein M0020_04625 [Actinomycetota bacterium]|nr:hypothetical protein [Actinomycetota bacterium]
MRDHVQARIPPITSDRALSRGRSTIATYAELLDDLLGSNPKNEAFVGRVHWPTDRRIRRE